MSMQDQSLPERAIQAYEALADLRISVHDFSGLLRTCLDPLRFWHSGPFCRSIKLGPDAHRCFQLEFTDLQAQFPQLIRQNGWLHRCHAGMFEWVVPVHWDNVVHAVLFAGQRQGDWEPKRLQQRSGIKTPRVPMVTRETSRHYMEALRQLAQRLKNHMLTMPAKNLKLNQTRSAIIARFIDRHHAEPLRLQDLALHLSLTPSRAAHVVKEECGQSWTALLLQARLRTACHLLRFSDEAISNVALASGFSDQSQFHKVFKRHFEMSPRAYRLETTMTVS